MMAIRYQCACSKTFSVREEWAGKRVRCPQCRDTFVVRAMKPRVSHDPLTKALDAFPLPLLPYDGKPLGLTELDAVREAGEIRRRIIAGRMLARFMSLLGAVISAFSLLGFVCALSQYSSRFFRPPATVLIGQVAAIALMAAMSGFSFFCAEKIRICRRWAAAILGGLSIAAGLVFALTATISMHHGLAWMGGLCWLTGPGICAAVFFRAYRAMPKFLERPRWVQEALLHAGY